jgi:hypothetical protein
MRNNFQPFKIRRAKKRLALQLEELQKNFGEEIEEYKKNAPPPTLWQKVKRFFDKIT